MHATRNTIHVTNLQCVNKKPPKPWLARNTGDTIDFENYSIQVFEDPSEKIVDFSPINIWYIGEDNVIEYTLPFGYEEAENDWIGVFRVEMHFVYSL